MLDPCPVRVQSRRFGRRPPTSGLRLETDIVRENLTSQGTTAVGAKAIA
jgi:hypothetical protein